MNSAANGLLAGLVVRIDHLGICVRDIDEAGAHWTRLLGQPVIDREDVAPQKATAAWLRLPGEASALELVAPMNGNAGLEKFLAKRGDGMHHIALLVTDIEEALRRLRDGGVELIDQAPRTGALGHLVAFLHPKAMGGTLVELVQHVES